jgi:hypothetical protein
MTKTNDTEMNAVQDTFKEYGFYVCETGGGCLAYRTDNENGSYLMVTDEGGCDIPREETDYLLVGYYENADDEGLVDTVSFIEFRDHYQI